MPIFPDALITAVLGYGVVFVGLILLMSVIMLTGKAMTAKKASVASPAGGASPAAAAVPAAPAAPANTGPVAPGAAGQIKLHGVDEHDAAMVMAIVADKLGAPVNELRFKSTKEVK